jgi:hypothetical protein
LKLLTDYGNKVTSGDRTATIRASCFVAPFWDMGDGMRSIMTKLISMKKFFNFYNEKRIDRDHLMEISSKWEDVEDYNYHFEFDKNNSNQRLFVPVRTFMSMIDEMKNIERYLQKPSGSSKLSAIKKMGIMVYAGAEDHVVSRDAINKVIKYIDGDFDNVIESSAGLGHSMMNHKFERDILATKVDAWFSKHR